ncbi:MAG TPA: ammonia-forming cytochrome c nitrite reductase subunit c552 [Longimicrobiales bacterium]|nr:ammonia-forming cytochrome c nitrite reductase subunit c552 [Longimicrobiales bacterium]
MNDTPKERRWSVKWIVAAAVAGALATLAGVALLTNILERQSEARNPFYRVVELNDTITDPAVWGKNFPLQYDDYQKTVDMVRTRYGGSEALPRVPDEADPREIVSQSKIYEDPRLVEMWAGYAFSHDFREERGHAYMLEDQLFTQRQVVVQQPGTCAHCHASVYVPYRKLGDGDLIRGFETMNQMPYSEAKNHFSHPVSCIDCHDPNNMQLRITRPGFMEGIAALKAGQGVADYDVNRDATRQEMRTYVCGQCHVEYYFKGPEKRLTYPWNKGLTADSILAYYEESGFKDWTHAKTGAPALKAQHPEFELYSQGIHARSGVACADCHMPYKREGAMKISDHHVRSPVLNLDKACQTCHRWSEEELKARVEQIQDRTFELRNIAMDALMELIGELEPAFRADSASANVRLAQSYQRKAQFLLDFVEAENSVGFHAPQEAARVLGNAINYARMGQIAVRGGRPGPVNPGLPPREGAPNTTGRTTAGRPAGGAVPASAP